MAGVEPQKKLKFQLIAKSYDPSSSPQCRINFTFHFRFRVSDFVLCQDLKTPAFLCHNDFSDDVSTSVSVKKFVLFRKTQKAMYEETRAAVGGVLSDVPISDENIRELIIQHAWIEAWRFHVRKNTLRFFKDLNLHFLVQIEDARLFHHQNLH